MVYRDFKDFSKRTAADKVLRDKTLNIAKNLEYDGYQCKLALLVYKFFDKTSFGSGVKSENYVKPAISWKITQMNYWKIWKTKAIIIF